MSIPFHSRRDDPRVTPTVVRLRQFALQEATDLQDTSNPRHKGLKVVCWNLLYTAVNGKVGWFLDMLCFSCVLLYIIIRHMKYVPLSVAASFFFSVAADVDQHQ